MITYKVNGVEMTKAEFDRRFRKKQLHGGIDEILKSRQAPGGDQPSCWPMKSRALGVHTSQRKEAYEKSVALGVPTEFDEKGHAIFRDREHRRKYCQATNKGDADGGYRDFTGD